MAKSKGKYKVVEVFDITKDGRKVKSVLMRSNSLLVCKVVALFWNVVELFFSSYTSVEKVRSRGKGASGKH